MHTSKHNQNKAQSVVNKCNKCKHQNKFPLLQHDRKDLKLRSHLNIIRSIPIEDTFSACAINILHNMVFKTKLKQLKAAVSLENIAGNISYQYGTEITLTFCVNTILQCNFFVLLY